MGIVLFKLLCDVIVQAEKHLTPALRQRLQQGGIQVEHLNVDTALDEQAHLAAVVHKGVGNAGELAACETPCEKRARGPCSAVYDFALTGRHEPTSGACVR